MFNFFKKKPKPCNEAFEDLAHMLIHEEENPTYRKELLSSDTLDYSLNSLKQIDAYLEVIRKDEIPEEDLVKVVLRAGAYVGEVMRKESKLDFHWLDFKEASKISSFVKSLGMQLGTASVLWSAPDNTCFPLAKILKYLENGSEDSTYHFANVLIDGLPKNTAR